MNESGFFSFESTPDEEKRNQVLGQIAPEMVFEKLPQIQSSQLKQPTTINQNQNLPQNKNRQRATNQNDLRKQLNNG